MAEFHDVNAAREMTPSAVLRYLQRAANDHFLARVPSFDYLRDEMKLAFVLSRMAVDMIIPIRYQDKFTVRTWTVESKGYAFNRCFEIVKDGEVAVRASSIWALLDLRDMKMSRVENHDFGFVDEPACTTDSPIRFRIPKHEEGVPPTALRQVLYSDIDCNMHMNNTRYPDLLCDYIPDIEHRRVRGFTVSWAHEASFGKTIEIFASNEQDDPNCFIFRMREQSSAPSDSIVHARIVTELME